MTNYEKHKDELIKKLLTESFNTCRFLRGKVTGHDGCGGATCSSCKENMLLWLDSEYKEPEIDWSKVPMGTPVRVWNDMGKKYEKAFTAYHEDNIFPFTTIDMTTETIGKWQYAELIEVDDENSNTND